MNPLHEKMFWTAMILILEPILVAFWPRLRAAFLLSYPFRQANCGRVEIYFDNLSAPLRIMSPFRVRLRKWMLCCGVLLMIFVVANQIYEFISF